MNKKEKTKDYITSLEVEETTEEIYGVEEAEVKIYGRVCNCKNLRVRATPSLNGEVCCVLPEDTEVEIWTLTNGFVGVTTSDGITGYCMSEFIKIED